MRPSCDDILRAGHRSRVWTVLGFLLAAVLTLTGAAGTASAAVGSTNQTRVKALNAETILLVGPTGDIGAGQHPVRAGPQQDLAQGRGVHTYYVIPTGTDGATTGQAVLVHNTSCPITPLSARESWGRMDTLDDHFVRHGADFGAQTADDYARMASEFYQRGLQNGLPTKLDSATGTVRIYDPSTNTFGSYNANGTTKTFYKPNPSMHPYASNQEYWESQAGGAPWGP